MRQRLLDLIVCPRDQQPLALDAHRSSGEHVVEGRLTCAGCAREYPIARGVPRLIDQASDARTAESFGFEWTTVDVTDLEEDVVTFFRKTGLDARCYDGMPAKEIVYQTLRDLGWRPDGSWLDGKLVLDAGCGMGRYLNVAKAYGCELVGMDFSRSVERAASVCQDEPKVHVVQADIFTPPFRQGTFEYIFSIGCLHHTPDPPAAFRSLAALCRPGGAVSVHVYPPQFWLGPIRGTITKGLRLVTVRLPHRWLYWLCRRVGSPLGRLQTRLAAHPLGKLLGSPLFLVTIPRHRKLGVMIGDTFDTYSAKHIGTYTAAQVMDWFHGCGFDEVRAFPYDTTVMGRRGSNGR